MLLSLSARADQRSHLGDIIDVYWLITIISPSPKAFKVCIVKSCYKCDIVLLPKVEAKGNKTDITRVERI